MREEHCISYEKSGSFYPSTILAVTRGQRQGMYNKTESSRNRKFCREHARAQKGRHQRDLLREMEDLKVSRARIIRKRKKKLRKLTQDYPSYRGGGKENLAKGRQHNRLGRKDIE